MLMIRFLWSNGGRPLVLAASAAIVAVTVFGIVWLAANFWPDGSEQQLFVFDTPFTIISENPHVSSGLITVGSGEVCNRTGESLITLTVGRYVSSIDNGGTQSVPAPEPVEPHEFPAGCLPAEQILRLPMLDVGTWKRVTITTFTYEGVQQEPIISESEPFEVVP